MANINTPNYYKTGKIECINAMEDIWGEEAVGIFCKLKAFKYLYRAGNKYGNSERSDIQKAIDYLVMYRDSYLDDQDD